MQHTGVAVPGIPEATTKSLAGKAMKVERSRLVPMPEMTLATSRGRMAGVVKMVARTWKEKVGHSRARAVT